MGPFDLNLHPIYNIERLSKLHSIDCYFIFVCYGQCFSHIYICMVAKELADYLPYPRWLSEKIVYHITGRRSWHVSPLAWKWIDFHTYSRKNFHIAVVYMEMLCIVTNIFLTTRVAFNGFLWTRAHFAVIHSIATWVSSWSFRWVCQFWIFQTHAIDTYNTR